MEGILKVLAALALFVIFVYLIGRFVNVLAVAFFVFYKLALEPWF